MTKEIKNLEELIDIFHKLLKEEADNQSQVILYEGTIKGLQKRHYTLTGRYYSTKKVDRGIRDA